MGFLVIGALMLGPCMRDAVILGPYKVPLISGNSHVVLIVETPLSDRQGLFFVARHTRDGTAGSAPGKLLTPEDVRLGLQVTLINLRKNCSRRQDIYVPASPMEI